MEDIEDINKQYSQKEAELLEINNNRIKVLKEQLQKKEAETVLFNQKQVEYQTTITQLEQDLHIKTQLETEYQLKFQDFKSLLDEKNMTIEQLQTEKEEAAHSTSEIINELRIKSETHVERSKAQSEQIQSLKWELDTQKRNYEKKFSEHLNKLESEISLKEREFCRKEQEMGNELENAERQFNNRYEQMKGALEKKCMALESKIASKENETTSLTQDRAKLQNECIALKETIDSLTSTSREKTNYLSREKETLSDKIQRISEERDKIQYTLSSQVEELKKALLEEHQDKCKIESELKCLKDKYAYECKANEESRKLEISKACMKFESDNKSLQQEVYSKDKEIDRFKQDIDDKCKDIEEYKVKLWKEASNSNKTHQKLVEENENKLQELHSQLLHCNFENRRLQENIKTQEEIDAKKTNEIRNLLKKITNANQTIEELKNELFKTKAYSRKNEEDLDNLRTPDKKDLISENAQLKV